MLIVAMDANFRLKSRLRGPVNKEPTLGMGWSYFVDNGPYSDFIKDYVDQEEVCVYNEYWSRVTYIYIDPDLRWFSGTPQYAYEKIERSPCNRHGCCQLCSTPTFSTVGHRRFAKG
jgi:hypothetical protein